MALITFDPSFKYSTTLSNGNLTALVPTYNSCARATEGKTSGKWYWEIKYVSGSNPMIGISAKSSVAATSVWTGNLGRFYYHNGTKYPGPITYSSNSVMAIGDIIGISIDLDSPSKTISFYRNGTPLGVAFYDLHLLEQPVYPFCIVGGSSAATFTANFGATDFDIVTRNSSEWERLISDGYMPYDIENSFISSISADKLFIKSVSEKISLNLDSIKFGTNLDSVKITINDKTIHDGQVMLPLPNNIVLQLNSSFITQSVNPMKIYANGNILVKTLNIYHETSLLNPLVRDFKNTKVDNMKLSIDTGTSLNNVIEGSVLLNIPTEMRSKVNKITVDGDTDKILNANGVYPLTNIDQYLYKTPIILNSCNRLIIMDSGNLSNIIYLKPPLEQPSNINITDNISTTTTTLTSGQILTWLFNSAGVSSIVITGTNGVVYIDLYNDLNTLVHTFSHNSTTSSSYIINKTNISKIVLRKPGGESCYIRDLLVYGYDDTLFYLYRSDIYKYYSPLNISSSKLIIENNTSPIDSTLVKSKKMGNLAFINNSSKLVLKKYDSFIDNPSSKIVRSKIVLSNKIPIRRIEIK